MIIHLRHPLRECPALAEIVGYVYDGEKVVGKLLQFADGHTVALKHEEIDELQEGLILPEDRLRNVASYLLQATEITRDHNGRSRSASYAGSKTDIAQAGRQLAEMILDYIDGVMIAVTDDTPF
jgi:hypothetical protein